MRRFAVPIPVLAVALLGLLAAGRPGAGTVAQEATPAAEEEFELPEGVSFEALGYGTAEALPPAPAEFVLFRFGLEPGASFDLDPGDPSLALAYVEAGALTVRVDAPMTVLRAAGAGTPFPEETEEVAAGTEFTLEAGDSALFPPHVAGVVRNDGAEPVAVLVANVGPLEGDEEGTPAAGTPTA